MASMKTDAKLKQQAELVDTIKANVGAALIAKSIKNLRPARGTHLDLMADQLAIQRDGMPDRKLRRVIVECRMRRPSWRPRRERGRLERFLDLLEWKAESVWWWLVGKLMRRVT